SVVMPPRKARARSARRGSGQYDVGLAKVGANYAPLSPLSFLARSARVYPHKPAVIDGERAFTYAEFDARCRRLASALRRRGIRRGDTVAVMAPNVPAMLESHYGVPMVGAVLNALNYRLDARSIAFILEHGRAKLLLADTEFAETVEAALALVKRRIPVIDVSDPGAARSRLGEKDYEDLLEEGDPGFEWQGP